MPVSKKKTMAFCIAFGIIAVIWIVGLIFDNFYTVTNYVVESEKISKGFRIVQISDLHNKAYGKENSRLIEDVIALEPDMILITGDITTKPHADNSYAFIKGVCGDIPVYYSTGNHEYYLSAENYDTIINEVADSGADVLIDEAVSVEPNGENISVVGIDDHSLNYDTIQKVLKTTDENSFSVVLAHEPQYIDEYYKTDADLVLCGHAHGGQIIIPFTKQGLYAPNQGIFPKYTQGMYDSDGTAVIISRGMANHTAIPRFFNQPEIVCIDVVGK